MPAAAAKPPISDAAGEFGRRVRARRVELELSQEEPAERCELHWSYLGQVERGQNNLTLHNILRVATALDYDAAELIRGLRPPSTATSPPQSRIRSSRK